MKKHNDMLLYQKIRLIFSIAPDSFLEMIFFGLLQSAVTLMNVWSVRQVMSLVQSGITPAFAWALLAYGLLMIASVLYSVWYKRYRVQFCQLQRYESRVRRRLFQKCDGVSNEALEIPGVHRMIRLADGARQNLFRYGEIWITLLMLILQALSVNAYIAQLSLWYWLLLPLSLVPSILHFVRETRFLDKYHRSNEMMKEEENQFLQAMVGPLACKETRTNRSLPLLKQRWQERRQARRSIEENQAKALFHLDLLTFPLSFVSSAGGFALSVILLALGKVDFASCTAGISAYTSLWAAFSSFMDMIGNENRYRIMTKPFFEYWAMPDRAGTKQEAFSSAITLDHVTFRYPNQQRPAIDDVSLTIRQGETIALVGVNGSGKTTLAHLLCGLYLPTEGRILYNGQDIRDFSEAALHENQSIVSQQFARYQMTVQDNILLGDTRRKDMGRALEKQKTWLKEDLAPDTFLGKEFGGVDLSGGQWQQLSCARGFYKESDWMVLDEATSAIDPLREKHMIDQFERELRGKTGVMITHRLSSIPLADRIIVLENGKISGMGKHSELLKSNPVYRKLWTVQTDPFKEQKE